MIRYSINTPYQPTLSIHPVTPLLTHAINIATQLATLGVLPPLVQLLAAPDTKAVAVALDSIENILKAGDPPLQEPIL